MKILKSKKKTPIEKKLKRFTKTIGFLSAAAVFAMQIYSVIPKDEKIVEVDTDKLATDFDNSTVK